MRRLILITGFNNWGKSTHIVKLFGGQTRFSVGPYHPSDSSIKASFTVESHSNDDVSEKRFIALIAKRLAKAPTGGTDLLCAFCPTRGALNDSLRILKNKTFSVFGEIHVVLLQYKWDWHAELRIKEIKSHLSADSRVRFTIINDDVKHKADSDRRDARDDQIRTYLRLVYP